MAKDDKADDQDVPHREMLFEHRRATLKVASDLGRWTLAAILTVSGGAIIALLGAEGLDEAVRAQLIDIFSRSLGLSLFAGMVGFCTFTNYGLAAGLRAQGYLNSKRWARFTLGIVFAGVVLTVGSMILAMIVMNEARHLLPQAVTSAGKHH